jgi:predicted nucleic acid-binding protein
MITALDTNVLFDILIPAAADATESKARLDEAYQEGGLVIGEMVYSELASLFPSHAELGQFLRDTAIRIQPSSTESLWLGGQRWRQYCLRRPSGLVCSHCGNTETIRCNRCGQAISARQHVLADFIIGAHALAHADRLLTRDRGYYATYFPELQLV